MQNKNDLLYKYWSNLTIGRVAGYSQNNLFKTSQSRDGFNGMTSCLVNDFGITSATYIKHLHIFHRSSVLSARYFPSMVEIYMFGYILHVA